MQLLQVFKNRRSVRKFLDEDVSQEDLIKMILAASSAPSARNSQPWRFIAVYNKEIVNSMANTVHSYLDRIETQAAEAANKQLIAKSRHYRKLFTFFKDAPLTVAVTYTGYEGTGMAEAAGVDSKIYSSGLQSVAAAIENFLLEAVELGYGSCWMTGPVMAYKELSKILKLEKNEQLVALLPVGRPLKIPKPKSRKDISEILKIIK